MQLSLNPAYLHTTRNKDVYRTPDETLKLCADAGFRVADYSPGIAADNWEARTASVIEAAARYGVTLEQSHAPYNRYSKLPLGVYRERISRSIIAASRMGNRYLVIHADDYNMEPDGTYDAAHAMDEMYEFWAPFVEQAISCNVGIAIETLFEDRGAGKLTRFTSRLDELVGLIDRFDDPMVTCCWDSGHARLAFTREGMADAMRTLGKRITCTHIHDNYYGKDLHLLPFEGDIPWEEQMKVLREIGYTGNLTFEFVYGIRPDSLVPDFLHTAYQTGQLLADMFRA